MGYSVCTAKLWRLRVKIFLYLSWFTGVFPSRCDSFIEGGVCEKPKKKWYGHHIQESQMFPAKEIRFNSVFSPLPLGIWNPTLWGLDCVKGFPALFPNPKTQHIFYWLASGWKYRSIFCIFPFRSLRIGINKTYKAMFAFIWRLILSYLLNWCVHYSKPCFIKSWFVQ